MSGSFITSLLRKPTTTGYFAGPTLGGASEAMFPELSEGSFRERIIYNPNATGSFWINIFGGAAAANANDCIEIPPGGGYSTHAGNAMTIIGTAAAKITWGER